MGTDIYGWVEVSLSTDYWYGVVRVRHLVERSYAAFGSLFDHSNIYDSAPIAAHRGFPPDLSDEVLRERVQPEDGIVDPTWVSWDELKVIDWDEPAHLPLDETDPSPKYPTRQEAMGPRWAALFGIMDLLAGAFDDEHVRLVVWFDID